LKEAALDRSTLLQRTVELNNLSTSATGNKLARDRDDDDLAKIAEAIFEDPSGSERENYEKLFEFAFHTPLGEYDSLFKK
jgi:hypothetical protein